MLSDMFDSRHVLIVDRLLRPSEVRPSQGVDLDLSDGL